MPEEFTPPASPTASFYDLSDDEEDYSTITHTSTGRGVKLLYTKSKVYVHPTPSAKDNIPGFIALIQQKPPPSDTTSTTTKSSTVDPAHLLLAWLPESALGTAYDTYVKVDLLEAGSPPKQSYLVPPPPISSGTSSLGSYSFSVPVSQIYSLLIRPPSLGWWWGSIIINSRGGDSFPALFFHDSECASTIAQSKARTRKSFDPFGESGELFWGGDEVLRWLKRFVKVERSEIERTVYLVNPTQDDLLSFGQRPVIDSTIVNRNAGKDEAGSSMNIAAAMDPFTKALKSARWSLLENFARVTQFSRQTASSIIDNPNLPPQVKKLLKNPDVINLQDDFDSARLYLARWAMGIAEQSEKERAKIVWKRDDMMEMEDSAVGEFEILDVEAGNIGSGDRRKMVEMKEWDSWWNKTTGRLEITADEAKERIFHGGCDAAVRKEAWLFLLEVYPWDSTKDERVALMNSRRDEYVRLKGKWWDDVSRREGEGEAGEYWRDQKNRIEKDVHRTDRNIPIFAGEDTPHPDPDSQFSNIGTNVHLEQMKDMLLTYNEYNTTLGYVQGMSDLLAPIYAVFQDDAVAFWAFVGFMERMERNFLRDQSGMRAQLVALDQLVMLMDPALWKHLEKADSTNFFFFFRMILVWYKREFEWNDVLRLWESLWTNYLSGQFHLFIALAILERHKTVIMDHLQQFDEVLKYINELSGTIELNSTLIRAEALFYKFQRTVEASDRRHGFPSPGTSNPMVRLQHKRSQSSTSTSSSANKGKAIDEGPEITEPLRALLSREILRVEKKPAEEEEGKGKAVARQRD